MSVLWLECRCCENIIPCIEWEDDICEDCERGYCDVCYLYIDKKIYDKLKPF